MPPQLHTTPDLRTPSDEDVARYLAEMCDELRRLTAGRPKLRTLAYLLDMARLEAERWVKPLPAGWAAARPSGRPRIAR